MTDDRNDLVFAHLKRSQIELVRVREDQRTQNATLMAVQQTLSVHTALFNPLIEDVATVGVRVDRIERRLDLVEPAK